MNTKWPFWRKTMLAGALWILFVMIVFRDNQRGVITAFAFAIGYGTLMLGFWSAMREKRESGGLFGRSESEPSEDEEEEEHSGR